jgi:hypothetical protein
VLIDTAELCPKEENLRLEVAAISICVKQSAVLWVSSQSRSDEEIGSSEGGSLVGTNIVRDVGKAYSGGFGAFRGRDSLHPGKHRREHVSCSRPRGSSIGREYEGVCDLKATPALSSCKSSVGIWSPFY